MTGRDEVKVARVAVARVRAHGTNVRKDLGDLRDLTDSVQRFGVMQPVIVEERGDHYRLRDGHRRIAVAQLLGLARVPAVIHTEALEDDEWLTHAVHANEHRRQLDQRDRVHAITKMRDAGMTLDGIAREFGVSRSTVDRWLAPTRPTRPPGRIRVHGGQLRAFTTAWRTAIESGTASAHDLLAALDSIARTGDTAAAHPDQSSARAADHPTNHNPATRSTQ